jgi:hypothetical protein
VGESLANGDKVPTTTPMLTIWGGGRVLACRAESPDTTPTETADAGGRLPTATPMRTSIRAVVESLVESSSLPPSASRAASPKSPPISDGRAQRIRLTADDDLVPELTALTAPQREFNQRRVAMALLDQAMQIELDDVVMARRSRRRCECRGSRAG